MDRQTEIMKRPPKSEILSHHTRTFRIRTFGHLEHFLNTLQGKKSNVNEVICPLQNRPNLTIP